MRMRRMMSSMPITRGRFWLPVVAAVTIAVHSFVPTPFAAATVIGGNGVEQDIDPYDQRFLQEEGTQVPTSVTTFTGTSATTTVGTEENATANPGTVATTVEVSTVAPTSNDTGASVSTVAPTSKDTGASTFAYSDFPSDLASEEDTTDELVASNVPSPAPTTPAPVIPQDVPDVNEDNGSPTGSPIVETPEPTRPRFTKPPISSMATTTTTLSTIYTTGIICLIVVILTEMTIVIA